MGQSEGKGPAIVLAGSVNSSHRILAALLRHRMHVVGVLGLSPDASTNVSGYTRLDSLAQPAAIPYLEFTDINQPEIVSWIRQFSPDIIFIVGLSQLVQKELLSLPRLGCVGFHPTRLPEGRGRAPVAWMALEGRSGASTFFIMDEGIDSGPILVQEPFSVSDSDYASDVVEKLELAIDRALDRWLPRVRNGEWLSTPQSPDSATFYGKRTPEDGIIHWEWPAHQIFALIRAASRPHPGAYTFVGERKMIIWRASLETHSRHRGVIGRILLIDQAKGSLVQTGDGLLWVTEIEWDPPADQERPPSLRVGLKLGYDAQNEVYLLRRRMADLEKRLLKNKP